MLQSLLRFNNERVFYWCKLNIEGGNFLIKPKQIFIEKFYVSFTRWRKMEEKKKIIKFYWILDTINIYKFSICTYMKTQWKVNI